jgi:hypothetical protein
MGNDRINDCVVACMGHVIEAWTGAASTRVVIQDTDVIATYSALTGYNPSTGTPDPGLVVSAAMSYWQRIGLAGHKIDIAATANSIGRPNTYQSMITYLIQYYCAAILSFHLPLAAIDAFRNGGIWDANMGPGAEFHCVPAFAYDQTRCDVVTWGQPQKVTWGFIAQYLVELWGVMSVDWMRANGSSPTNESRQFLDSSLPNLLTWVVVI